MTAAADARWAGASDLPWEHRQRGTRLGALPEDVRPETRQEGYAIQALLEQRSARLLFGGKVAATSTAGQAHINVDGPLAGRLLRERAFDAGVVLPFGANHMRVAGTTCCVITMAAFAYGSTRATQTRSSLRASAPFSGSSAPPLPNEEL